MRIFKFETCLLWCSRKRVVPVCLDWMSPNWLTDQCLVTAFPVTELGPVLSLKIPYHRPATVQVYRLIQSSSVWIFVLDWLRKACDWIQNPRVHVLTFSKICVYKIVNRLLPKSVFWLIKCKVYHTWRCICVCKMHLKLNYFLLHCSRSDVKSGQFSPYDHVTLCGYLDNTNRPLFAVTLRVWLVTILVTFNPLWRPYCGVDFRCGEP